MVMSKHKILLTLTIVLAILLSLCLYVMYRFHLNNQYTYFRCSQAGLNTSIMTMEVNQDFNNKKLVDSHTLIITADLISVIHYHKDWPELLSDHEKAQLKKSVERIEALVAEGKLDFLSRSDLAEETKAFIEEGIAAIKSDNSSQ